MSISIIYLTYNRLNYTKQSLPALLNCDDIDYKVYIRDNGSTDGTIDYLKSLAHPRIADIKFFDSNRGIAPVVNEFWHENRSEILGKIDNDIIVPDKWVSKTMKVLENAEKEKIGTVSCWHWMPEWIQDVPSSSIKVITLQNGSQIHRVQHVGGNYLMHRYLLNAISNRVDNGGRLKGGFSAWQAQGNSKGIKNCFLYPFEYFINIPLHEWLNGVDVKKMSSSDRNAYEFERYKQAKVFLEY